MKLSTKSNVPAKSLIVAGALIIFVMTIAVAQQTPPTKPASVPPVVTTPTVTEMDDLYFSTKVGSFKILQKGPDAMPKGTVTMSFTGSVLISNLKGTVTPSGSVRREYNDAKRNKQVWFGTGKLVISGEFQAIQWFGRDLNAQFHGNAVVRLVGEFDKDLETGYFWFDPAHKQFWGNNMRTVAVPEESLQTGVARPIMREDFEKQKAAEAKKNQTKPSTAPATTGKPAVVKPPVKAGG